MRTGMGWPGVGTWQWVSAQGVGTFKLPQFVVGLWLHL